MKLTNKLNFPQALVDAVSNDIYSKYGARFSVTELLSPPRQKVLQRQHEAEITEDVSEVIYRLTGQIGHAIIERAASKDIVERVFVEEVLPGCTLKGQADIFANIGEVSIEDWKFVTLWSYKDGVKPEYVAQLNMLRWLARKEFPEVTALYSVPIYRDWSKREAERNPNYPQQGVERFKVEMWPLDRTEAFIKERIQLHVTAEVRLPDCTPEERWAGPDLWKCYKAGGKRAVPGGVFTDTAQAGVFASKQGLEVRKTAGESIRCQSYCNVAKFCVFAQSMGYAKTKGNNEDVPSVREG